VKQMQKREVPESGRPTVAEKIAVLSKRVRERKQGGHCESVIVEGIKEINRLIQQEALEERGQALGEGVFFPFFRQYTTNALGSSPPRETQRPCIQNVTTPKRCRETRA